MDLIELAGKLQGLGVAGLALVALYITNRFWVKKLAEVVETHKEEVVAIRAEHRDYVDRLSAIIEQKNAVIEEQAGARVQAGEDRRLDVERFLTRDAELAARYEASVTQTTQNVSALTAAIKALTGEVRARG